MAKQTLPTNFKDDVLNTSMSGKRKWNISQNADGTYSITDVTTYDQVGSEFGAGELNATNQAVNQSLDKAKVIDDLETIQAVTNEGFVMGALAGKALNESLQAEDIDTSNWTVNYGIEIISAKYYPCFKKVEIKFINGDTGYAHNSEIITGIDDKYCPEEDCYIGSILGRTSDTTLDISRGLLSTDGTITAKHLVSGSLKHGLCNGFWYVK